MAIPNGNFRLEPKQLTMTQNGSTQVQLKNLKVSLNFASFADLFRRAKRAPSKDAL